MKAPPIPPKLKRALLAVGVLWFGVALVVLMQWLHGDESREVLGGVLLIVGALITVFVIVYAMLERNALRLVQLIADARAEAKVETERFIRAQISGAITEIKGGTSTTPQGAPGPMILGPVLGTAAPVRTVAAPTLYAGAAAQSGRMPVRVAGAAQMAMPANPRAASSVIGTEDVERYVEGLGDAWRRDEEHYGGGPLSDR